MGVFKDVQNLQMFTWVPKLVLGFTQENMNLDDLRTSEIVRRLTVISNERAKTHTEQLGFDSQESENINNFFSREIKKNDAKEVLSTITKLFKDVKNIKLKKYLIEALTKHVSPLLI